MSRERPDPFLELRVHELELAPTLSGLCAGYEDGAWRASGLAQSMCEWLTDWALTPSEHLRIKGPTAAQMIRKAAQRVYNTENYRNRGEVGELLMHIALQEVFDTEPVVSKMYFKDAANDVVKGFDCVHVLAVDGDLELWLGEAKFYGDPKDALRAAAASVSEHLRANYLREEFAMISDKIDTEWEGRERLLALLHRNTSLDKVFRRLRVPILVTYDSPMVQRHRAIDDPYPEEFAKEVRALQARLAGHSLPDVVIHLLAVPLGSKRALADAFHLELRSWQGPTFTSS